MCGIYTGETFTINGGNLNISSEYGSLTAWDTIINDGNIVMNSGILGIRVYNSLEINGGNINITAEETGIEGIDDSITVNDGNIAISANEYGINSRDTLIVNGGNIEVDSKVIGIISGLNTELNGGCISCKTPEENHGIAFVANPNYLDEEVNVKISETMQIISNEYGLKCLQISDSHNIITINVLTFGKEDAAIWYETDEKMLTKNVANEIKIVPKYKVSFNTNGGSNILGQSLNLNEKVIKPENPTKEEYTFDGWYKDKKLTEPFDFETKITEDITLYAKWKNTTCTVTFNTNGGSQVQKLKVLNGNKANKPENPTKEEYIFDGWYKDEKLTEPFDFETQVTQDITLYAKWTENNSNKNEPNAPNNSNNSNNQNDLNNSNKPSNPKTGDSGIGIYIALILFSIIGIKITSKKKKNINRKSQ